MILAFNEAQIVLLILGFSLEALAAFLVISGKAEQMAGANALNRINLNLPSWLFVLILGAVLIAGSLIWEWDPLDTGGGSDPEPQDETLQPWLDECAANIMESCDLIYEFSPLGSVDEEFGATCGYRLEFWDPFNCWSYEFED